MECLLRTFRSQRPLSRETTFVIGRLGSAPKQGLWLVCHGGKLATLNLPCLREVALFRKLKQTYVVPAEELRPSLVVTPSMLARPESWNTLALLKQEKRDLSGLSYIVDPLLTYNGFYLRLLPGDADQKADVVRKASGVNVSDLSQILAAISCRTSNDAITVEGTRPTSVLDILRQEARRMVQSSVPNCPENVRDSVEDLDKRCLHGNTVCAAFFDMKDVANA